MKAIFGLIALATAARADTLCLACDLVIGLVAQGIPSIIKDVPDPDSLCKDLSLCDGTCPFWSAANWPVLSPEFPTNGKAIDDLHDGRSYGNDSSVLARHPEEFGSIVGAVQEYLMKIKAAAPAGVEEPSFQALFATVLGGLQAAQAASSQGENSGGGDVMHIAERLHSEAVAAGGGKALVGTVGEFPCGDLLNFTCVAHRFGDLHLPLFDQDDDYYAGNYSWVFGSNVRGGAWRGGDCNDTDASIYPGRRVGPAGDALRDTNCNGIVGRPSASEPTYEEQFCSGENAPMGIGILGDSATAHFSIPAQYVNAGNFSLEGVVEAATNELDWPQCSWGTGVRDTEGCPESLVPMASLYQRWADRNACAHRDFQGLGVNGARVSSVAETLAKVLKRSKATDTPMMVIHSLIGNDVCNGHPGISHMTTPSEFEASVLSTLDQLDAKLPNGSHVAFIGLVDGRVLWDTMNTLQHPTGVPYPVLYDALSCNGANPCWGWLNSNATWRNITSERARNLTAVYDKIIAQRSYKSFDMYRLKVDWPQLVQKWEDLGHAGRDLIEPVDGFHPSQTGNQLLAQLLWEELEDQKPHWLPKVNPHNAAIKAMFGDQGGY